MIKVFSKSISLPKVIEQVDFHYDTYINLRDLNDIELGFMKKYDGAVVESYDADSICTPFGTVSKDNISTGTKTLILANYYKRAENQEEVLLCCDECGQNIFDDLFAIVDNSNISLLLHHSLIPSKLCYDFIVNDKITVKTSQELRRVLKNER